jgi:gamma-glutamyltranspeptidase / glutathione hydrolase / leukotriene-C4 hydrolase
MKRINVVGISFLVVLLLSGLGVGLFFLLRSDDVPKGAVASTTVECTDAAVEILNKGGSAVDAAISASLCQGLTEPQSSGLGGGFIATIYIKETGTIETLNAREVAPLKAFKDMYTNDVSSREGGLAVAVPTELKGLYELHQKYGKLKWKEVVQPVIDIAEKGYKVTGYLASLFETSRGDKIRETPGYRETFINQKTNEFWKEGDVITNQKLANTFKIIAKEGSDAFYSKTGTFTQKIVDEIQSNGGIITIEDLTNYKPKWGKPSESKLFNGENLYTFPMPATGSVINFIMNILDGYKFQNEDSDNNELLYHRLVEAFKFAFAKRTKLGDETSEEVLKTLRELESSEFADKIRAQIDDDKTYNSFEHYGANASVVVDHGTSHFSILAPNGDAVALTSTINFM